MLLFVKLGKKTPRAFLTQVHVVGTPSKYLSGRDDFVPTTARTLEAINSWLTGHLPLPRYLLIALILASRPPGFGGDF